MPTHHEKIHLPYPALDIYHLVLDIHSYPDFVPWCVAARVLERKENELTADLVIHFKGFQERYTSQVRFLPPEQKEAEFRSGNIIVELVEGPFSHLKNIWKFTPTVSGGCDLEFFIDFQFKSKLLDKLMGLMFARAQSKMVQAFCKRAEEKLGR